MQQQRPLTKSLWSLYTETPAASAANHQFIQRVYIADLHRCTLHYISSQRIDQCIQNDHTALSQHRARLTDHTLSSSLYKFWANHNSMETIIILFSTLWPFSQGWHSPKPTQHYLTVKGNHSTAFHPCVHAVREPLGDQCGGWNTHDGSTQMKMMASPFPSIDLLCVCLCLNILWHSSDYFIHHCRSIS